MQISEKKVLLRNMVNRTHPKYAVGEGGKELPLNLPNALIKKRISDWMACYGVGFDNI